MSMLPRYTKVVVTGNKRTKSNLVGLQGVVKKAVGLGGWHCLVLANGVEVNLQRNALSVIEAPGKNEDGDDLVIENGSWSRMDLESDGTQKSQTSRHHMHKSSSSSHKPMNTLFSRDSQNEDSVSVPCCRSKVDLSKLETATLWRYWRHFNLNGDNPNLSREELVDVVQRHFISQQLDDEMQVVARFAQSAKRQKTLRK